MNPSKRGRATRLALAAIGAAAALAIFAGVAAATGDPISGTVTITGGSLSMPTWPRQVQFPGFTLDGTTHTVEDASDGTFEVTDYTGSGSGWKITAQATDFTFACNGTSTPTCASPTTRTLPATTALVTNGGGTSASTTAPSVSCQSGVSTDCTTGTSSVNRVVIPIAGSAATIFEQPADSGMGDIKVSGLNWWLTVPPSAYAGDYTSTITLDIATGP